MEEFRDKSVLITGAGRGLGQAMARDFAKAGARVAVNYTASEESAAETVAEIAAAGGRAIAVGADVSVAGEVAAMIDRVVENFGGIDILVNNAGINIDAPFLELAEDDWDRVLAVNLKGPFLCAQAAGRHMVAAGAGSIVNISAVTGIDARKNAANFCASKAGLNMLTKCMALELGPAVNVNALGLGYVTSPLTDKLYSPEGRTAIIGETPLGRMGEFGEVSQAVMFLASAAAAFMTGQTMIFDGGRIMR